jgi:hypothetical protein
MKNKQKEWHHATKHFDNKKNIGLQKLFPKANNIQASASMFACTNNKGKATVTRNIKNNKEFKMSKVNDSPGCKATQVEKED